MTYIDAGLFFARITAGQRFRFRQKPGSGTDTDEGVVLRALGGSTRLDGWENEDADSLHVPFVYPNGDEGAFWRSACDDREFEILEGETR